MIVIRQTKRHRHRMQHWGATLKSAKQQLDKAESAKTT
jgi:hypothetical protein